MSSKVSNRKKRVATEPKDPLDIAGYIPESPSSSTKPSSSLDEECSGTTKLAPVDNVGVSVAPSTPPKRGRKRKLQSEQADETPTSLESPLQVAEPPKKRGRKPKSSNVPLTSNGTPQTAAASPLLSPPTRKTPLTKAALNEKDTCGEASDMDGDAGDHSTPSVSTRRRAPTRGTPVEETPPMGKRVSRPNRRYSDEPTEEAKTPPSTRKNGSARKGKKSVEQSEPPPAARAATRQRSVRPQEFPEPLDNGSETSATEELEKEDLTPVTPSTAPAKKRGRKPKNLPSTPAISVTLEEVELEATTPPASPSSPPRPNPDSSRMSVKKKRGRPKTVTPARDPNTSTSTPVSSKRKAGRPPTPKSPTDVVCGACQKSMPLPTFKYHRYAVHQGLARVEGESQEFTELEKAQELKKTLEKVKKLVCPKCSTGYTTLLGYQYHQKRCGMDADELRNLLAECTVCGKKVAALAAHMKIHEKKTDTEELRQESSKKKIVEFTPSPGTKSRRAAAHKASSMLREMSEDLMDTLPAKGSIGKAVKLFTEPRGSKVTNSIIGVWKREMEKDSVARCRYPSCPFTSNELEKLKEHHGQCEIGLKTKAFACLKCPYNSLVRAEIVEHVLNSHFSEKDAAFELSGSGSSSGESDSSDGENEVESEGMASEGEASGDGGSIPRYGRTLDKAYGLSNSSLHLFKSHTMSPLIPLWLAQFHKVNFNWDASLYTDWKARIRELEEKVESYVPPTEESIPFGRRFITAANFHPTSTDVPYETLPRFQGILQNGTPVFFCGGPIQSAAWCPMPAVISPDKSRDVGRDQYLAVSAFREEYRTKSATLAPFESKEIIQIWNCGPLCHSNPTTTAPTLELCLAHGHGRIWSLVWCPSGCYDQKRLGLLAAACSDGTVRLFTVPQPADVTQESGSTNRFYQAEANVTLELNTKEKSECTSLHWDQTLGHRFIAAGFANGIVGLWDLGTKSPLLRNDDRIYPVWSFYAHNAIVTALSLSPQHAGARFLATASVDRSVKLWDRFDPAVPVCWSRRSRVTDIKWRRHWPGVLVCVEDVCQLFRTSSVFYDFGYTGNRQPLLPQNSVVRSAAENEYLDLVAHCTTAGEIVVYPSHLAIMDCDDKKLRKQRKIVLRTDLVGTDDTDGSFVLNKMDKVYLQALKSNKKPTPPTVDPKPRPRNYSLIFNDVTTVIRPIGNRKQPAMPHPLSDNMDIHLPCDDPISSINRISFNPNLESHTWICVAGENGLIQLLRVDTPSISKVTEGYVKEVNS